LIGLGAWMREPSAAVFGAEGCGEAGESRTGGLQAIGEASGLGEVGLVGGS
jgi:hypothetical protein